MSTTTVTASAGDADIALGSPEERKRRLRLGFVLLAAGLIALILALTTAPGSITFRLATGQQPWLPEISLPAKPLALVLAAYTVAVAVTQLLKGLRGALGAMLFTLFGVGFIVAFVCWAAVGEEYPLTTQLQETINVSAPLIFGALAGVLCERAGVINIAIEGQFLAGAFAAAILASVTQNQVAGLVGAMAAGMFIALLLAVFSIRYLVNQVVLGVVLVVFATGITGFLFDALVETDPTHYNAPGVLAKVPIPGLEHFPVLGPVLFDQTVLVYLMYLAVALVTFVLFRTTWGLRVRAVGEHPRAADTVGIRVLRTRYQAVLLGGLVAGLGGAFFTIGSTGGFSKEMTASKGFIALAAVIMGRWHPLGATLAALFFGFTSQLQSGLGVIETPIPSELLRMLPYLLALVAVAGLIGRVRPPKADGEPYTKE
ncbi:MAG TPA: ABC transporter permease [Actinopolymorphaceae bacterium]